MAITFKKKYKDEMTGEWACPVCEIKMDSQHAFTVHIRQHNPTDHSHTCSICSKQLSSASSLDRHMLIHSGERPFKCRVCNMAFTTNGNMHRHEKTHGIYGPGSRVRGSTGQDQAMNYLNSNALDEDGLRIRNKKKRKPKSLPNSNSPKNTNAQSQNSSFGCFDDLSLKETFLSFLQLQQQNRNFNGDFNFDANSNDNSSTALLNNSNLLNNSLTAAATGNSGSLNVSALNKTDLADLSSIFAVISNAQQQFPSFNDEQIAKLNQLATINQQVLQDQSTLLNLNSTTNGTKQAGKRSKNNQINGISTRVTNGQSNGKRVKREFKNSIENDFSDQLNSLTSLNNLNNNLSSLAALKNNSLNSINNLINSTTKEDDQRSDKSSAKNSSDIENEMTNRNKHSMNDKTSTVKLNSSTTSQQLTNNEDIIDDNTIEDEDEFSRNLSEEEEVNKMEQEFSEQIKDEEKKKNDESESKKDEKKSTANDEDKKNEQIKAASDLIKNGIASLIVPKKSTAPVNLADLIIKSDKNNNKSTHTEYTHNTDLNRHLFIDPMAEDDVKLLEKQLQDQQYLCKNCGLEVRSVNTLRRHQRLHEAGGQLYGCNFCNYTSLDKSSLIRHLRTHNGERPYQCGICKYAFTTKANCERHVRKRHKKIDKKDICYSMQYKAGGNTNSDAFSQLNGGQPTSDNQNELINNSSLDNLPPSSLVETNKSLLASSNMHLIPHVFYEPNSMETSCRFCNKDFRFNRLLKQHIRTMMNNNFTKKPYNCILCNQGFTTKNTCIRHFEKNHKDVPHDQIQNMIIENRLLLDDQHLNNSSNRLNNRGLNASALAAFSSTTGSGSSELMSNGDSSELDQPLNLANGFYSSLNKMNNRLNDKYMMDEDEDFGDDEDNQNALDLSVKSNERASIDQLSSMSRSLDLSAGSTNNQLNEPNNDMISAISALLAIQSAMPKSLNNNDNQLMTNSLLSNQTNNLSSNISNLLATQQLQSNLNTGSLINLFTSLSNLSTPQF